MSNRRLCFDVLLVLLLLKIHNVDSSLQRLDVDSINRLLSGGYRTLTILLPPGKPELEDTSRTSDEDATVNPKVNLDENKAYNLYAILRSTQESQPLDAKTHDNFETTKQLLRQALRRRCQKLDSCVKKCPKKTSWSCTVSCKQDIDDRDLCQEPEEPKCKRPKCGRTMPPNWF